MFVVLLEVLLVLVVKAFVDAGGVAELLLTELADRNHLMLMAENAQRLAKPNAAARVADVCEELARG